MYGSMIPMIYMMINIKENINMKHIYNRNYDYSETSANIRISMDKKLRLKAFSESLCDPDTVFVSMKDVVDNFLDGNRETIENYLTWLKENS